MGSNTKTQVNCQKAKKRRFAIFCCHFVKKISNGRQSDNFDPRRSAYGSSESLCPKFSETPVKKVSIFKIEGVMPLQSRVIMICVTPKSCFSAFFERKKTLTAKPSILDPIVLGIFEKLSIWRVTMTGWNSIFYILWSVRFLGLPPDWILRSFLQCVLTEIAFSRKL